MKKKVIIISSVGVLLLLILTNPSMSDFKSFLPSETMDSYDLISNDYTLARKNNFFIFSIYWYRYDDKEAAYLGVFGNFIKTWEPEKEASESIFQSLEEVLEEE